jgi:hypothetical protein
MNQGLRKVLTEKLEELEQQKKIYENNPRSMRMVDYEDIPRQIRKITRALKEDYR